MEGLFVLDKSAGITSAAAVDRLKRVLPAGVKVGHAGTLDRFASGLLMVLVGAYTRRCEEVMSWAKTYQTTIKLGATTATDDPDSPEVPSPAPAKLQRAEIELALADFIGLVRQRPPLYSAVKISGSRASDRARRGHAPALEPRIVQIDRIEIMQYDWPRLQLSITCGRGTYVRAIARDLGEKLGVGGYVTALRRTQVGEYGTADAMKLEDLTRENLAAGLRTIKTA